MNGYEVTIKGLYQCPYDQYKREEVESKVGVNNFFDAVLEAITLIKQYEDDRDIVDITEISIKEV